MFSSSFSHKGETLVCTQSGMAFEVPRKCNVQELVPRGHGEKTDSRIEYIGSEKELKPRPKAKEKNLTNVLARWGEVGRFQLS